MPYFKIINEVLRIQIYKIFLILGLLPYYFLYLPQQIHIRLKIKHLIKTQIKQQNSLGADKINCRTSDNSLNISYKNH